jgi:hypothetical protein
MTPRGVRWTLVWGVWVVLWTSWLSTACRCSGTDVVARLVTREGTVERDWAKRQNAWQSAPVGTEFRLGDGVRSQTDSTATFSLRRSARLILAPKSTVRFLARGKRGEAAIDVQLGRAELETGDAELRVQSTVGGILIEPHSRVRLDKSDRGVRFEVALGALRLEEGDRPRIAAGDGVEVALGGAVLERYGFDAGLARPAPSASVALSAAALGTSIEAETTGSGASRRDAKGEWIPLVEGKSTLGPDTALKIDGNARVRVTRGSEDVTLGQGEYVVGGSDGQLVRAMRGPVRLSSTGRTSIAVPGGTIVAEDPDTVADVMVNPDKGTTVNVRLGRVRVNAQNSDDLGAGEVGTLAADGKLSVAGRGPSPPDLVAQAGDSFIIHDPSPPTVVGIATRGACPQGAVLRMSDGQWSSGKEIASARLPVGAFHYEVHCLSPQGPTEHAARSGTINVIRDAGTAPVVRTAPATSVDTDGRRYTVLYQSRLPKISVGWSGAPAAPYYTLHVDSRTIRTTTPNHAFGEGAMPEGTHTVVFEAATTPPKRSRVTTIAVTLDRATPTATISYPPNGAFAAGSEITVSGVALPGWKVRVGDQEVNPDGQSRFETKATLPAGKSCLPVAFEAPGRGTHYYLRRTSAGP